jgi:uncharacterized protein YkwD
MSKRDVTARLLLPTLLAATALMATPAPAATPAEVRYANKITKVVNEIRDENGRVELKKQRCLQRLANRHAQRMADQQRLFHQDLGKIQRACDVGSVGENVAMGSSVEQMVELWMNSAPHRSNILNRRYRLTGVGARQAGGYWWAAQVFGRSR